MCSMKNINPATRKIPELIFLGSCSERFQVNDQVSGAVLRSRNGAALQSV